MKTGSLNDEGDLSDLNFLWKILPKDIVRHSHRYDSESFLMLQPCLHVHIKQMCPYFYFGVGSKVIYQNTVATIRSAMALSTFYIEAWPASSYLLCEVKHTLDASMESHTMLSSCTWAVCQQPALLLRLRTTSSTKKQDSEVCSQIRPFVFSTTALE